MRKAFSVSAFLVAAALVASVAGCSSGNDDPKIDPNLYKSLLYMTDTYSGKVYTYDPATHAAAGASLAAVGRNSTGELAFYKGVGYACVGSGDNAGVYYFDPSAANPSFTKIPGTVCAAYCAFASDTRAYVSVYDYFNNSSGIHTFNPSAPGDGISSLPLSGTDGDGFQEMVITPDGKLYAANITDGSVLRINATSGAIEATIDATAAGTTGLAAGTYKGSAGVFAANTSGSIDFIASTALDGSAAEAVASSSIYPGRVLQLPSGDLIATGYDPSYVNHSYFVDLSAEFASVTELLCEGSSFGGLDVASKDGLVYIPATVTSDYVNFSNYLYVLDESGAQRPYSPLSVMGASQSMTNIAFYED